MSNMLTILNLELKLIVIILKVKQLMQLQDGPSKVLRERLTGKEGQIRNNLLGKRCEMSARTVIGPDPTLKIDEVVVPKEIAQSLTFPDFVNKHNIDRLTKLVNSGNAISFSKKKMNLDKKLKLI